MPVVVLVGNFWEVIACVASMRVFHGTKDKNCGSRPFAVKVELYCGMKSVLFEYRNECSIIAGTLANSQPLRFEQAVDS